ncbi:MAG: N-6 DNA methylase, partial [Thaumarchaeota archaeon]|nr:N-6 DNA methylase [Nitrososphaerota archaeon]
MSVSKTSELFSPKTIKKMCEGVIITDEQKSASAKWIQLLDDDKLQNEEKNYPRFMKFVLSNILGYSIEDIRFEDSHVEFSWGPDGKSILCIEVKGTSTRDLFALQYRKKEHSTPIKQLWDYMGGIDSLKYGICTNYRHFVLLTKKLGYTKYHVFDFGSIKEDPDMLKEFVSIFSKQRIEAGFIEKIQTESQNEEKELTEEFYQLYGQTRLMLIKEFQSIGSISKKDAVSYAQTFLNRLIFVFFAEDYKLIDDRDIFSTNVCHIIHGQLGKTTKRVWTYLVDELFVYFEKGSEDPHISEFNGGLFKNELPRDIYFYDKRDKDFFKEVELKISRPKTTSWKFKKDIEAAVKSQKNLNPLIKNLLMLSSYDFESQIRVNILGHIFENSILELEKLLHPDHKVLQNDSQRKREGVFYTPESIAKYICRNTIIPYLSKSGTNDIYVLINEYADNISVLEQRLRELKILDPACGSGAFLIEAANTLIEIYEQIQQHKSLNGNFNKNTLEEIVDEARIRLVVKNNLYGIDVNFQAIEITKLSMFLMTASRNEKLQNLSENFVVGNSVIYTKDFNWDSAFPKLEAFDIIIGNPPYVRQEDIKNKDDMQLPSQPRLVLPDKFQIQKTSDLSTYFFYHSLFYLKPGGKIGFITSDSWLHWNYGSPLKKLLLDNCKLGILMKTDFNVFRDADVKTVTAILTKKDPNSNYGSHVINIVTVHDQYFSNQSTKKIPQYGLEGNHMNPSDNWTLYFVNPIPEPKIPMIAMSNIGVVRMGKKTGHNAFFVINKQTIDKYRIDKKYYRVIIPDRAKGVVLDDNAESEYILFVQESKRELLQTDQGKRVLRYIEENNVSAVPKRGKDKNLRLVSELSSVESHRPFWYSLNLSKPAPIFLSLFANEKIKVYENTGRVHALNNYAEFTPNVSEHTRAYLAFLSSSWFALFLEK